ncbi:unnamed protein product [Ambrosiozyma monospora]|uniref:Unnamed protein product n=1 Tax=Ambrosiozyma monospora TaxID=43982 RepID=A0ACB5TLF9_AMBMO|nr:unnamed protein product [Ambrosiozyma monospora]
MHPVLACFGDQDSMVRYFACEALYNIAKVSKGEILVYFNEIFDVLCKLVADVDISVKNAADILDRLIKDITSEKAATYVSILSKPSDIVVPTAKILDQRTGKTLQVYDPQLPRAFSLSKFIPLLKERMYATNPYTRMFLVSWLRLLDSIPDLELISYLPSFLDALLTYLNASLDDVRVVTENFLKLLLHEIKRISEIQAMVREAKEKRQQALLEQQQQQQQQQSQSQSQLQSSTSSAGTTGDQQVVPNLEPSHTGATFEMSMIPDEGVYIPGQDVIIDYPKIIDILIGSLDSSDELIQMMSLEWLLTLIEISPDSFVMFMPKLLSVLLTTIYHPNHQLQAMTIDLNNKLIS